MSYGYFRELARQFDQDALQQIKEHADRHSYMAADPDQREGRAKAALKKLSAAIEEVMALAEEGDE